MSALECAADWGEGRVECDERVHGVAGDCAPLRSEPRNLSSSVLWIPLAAGCAAPSSADGDTVLSTQPRCRHAAANVVRSRVLSGGNLHQPGRNLSRRMCVCGVGGLAVMLALAFTRASPHSLLLPASTHMPPFSTPVSLATPPQRLAIRLGQCVPPASPPFIRSPGPVMYLG
jgi:hypothetical protein